MSEILIRNQTWIVEEYRCRIFFFNWNLNITKKKLNVGLNSTFCCTYYLCFNFSFGILSKKQTAAEFLKISAWIVIKKILTNELTTGQYWRFRNFQSRNSRKIEISDLPLKQEWHLSAQMLSWLQFQLEGDRQFSLFLK